MDKKDVLEAVKKSKKYSGLTEQVILREIEKFAKRYPAWQDYKKGFIAKQIKSELHKAYGSFQTYKKGKIKKLLEELRNNRDNEIIREILGTNLSTKERLPYYGLMYEKIFEVTGNVDSILDLGCGLNPISYPYMELDEDTRYYAYDINEKDLDVIREFFDIYAVNSHVQAIDLRDIKEIKKLPPADICFLFKVLDPLEKNEKGHKLGEEIIKILSRKCKFIVASFATKTLSGKQMSHPYRGWIERMLKRIALEFDRVEIPNEIFYVISKK